MPKRTNKDNRPEMCSIAELIKKARKKGGKIEKRKQNSNTFEAISLASERNKNQEYLQ